MRNLLTGEVLRKYLMSGIPALAHMHNISAAIQVSVTSDLEYKLNLKKDDIEDVFDYAKFSHQSTLGWLIGEKDRNLNSPCSGVYIIDVTAPVDKKVKGGQYTRIVLVLIDINAEFTIELAEMIAREMVKSRYKLPATNILLTNNNAAQLFIATGEAIYQNISATLIDRSTPLLDGVTNSFRKEFSILSNKIWKSMREVPVCTVNEHAFFYGLENEVLNHSYAVSCVNKIYNELCSLVAFIKRENVDELPEDICNTVNEIVAEFKRTVLETSNTVWTKKDAITAIGRFCVTSDGTSPSIDLTRVLTTIEEYTNIMTRIVTMIAGGNRTIES